MTDASSTVQDRKAYRYFAFISYSSKDKKVAEKLQNQIEAYRLPTVLRNELEEKTGKKYPERVKPLFRDMTDLNAGVLGQSILRELEDSRYLLVLCTPNSAQSEWVNQEIENFILMGRYENIILYIVDGEPNSTNPANECFPPILRKNREYLTYSDMTPEQNAERQAKLHALLDGVGELKGLSIQGEGPKVARLKAIAKMLEVEPDVLIQRDKQRQKQVFRRNMTIILSLLLCCIIAGLYVWDRYYRVHVGYYADYVEKWGVPEGIIPLTQNQIAKRHDHYRIYTQNQLVQRLEHVNSAGTPIPVNNSEFKDRPMIAVYSIYKGGRLIQRDTLNKNGKVLMSYIYSGNRMQKVEFKGHTNDGITDTLLLANLTSINQSLDKQESQKTNIGGMKLIRDDYGRVVEVRFLKAGYRVPIADKQGVAGFRYKLDNLGRIIEKIYLNQDGQPQPDTHNVIRRTYHYDNNSNLDEIKYYDPNGNVIFDESSTSKK